MQEIIDKVVEGAGNIAESVTDIKESGADKISSALEEVNSSSEIIAKAGFKISELGVSLGLPPEVTGIFLCEREISHEEKEALLKETEEKTMVNMILKSLFKASDFYHSLKLGNFKLKSISLSMGLTPGISIKFAKVS